MLKLYVSEDEINFFKLDGLPTTIDSLNGTLNQSFKGAIAHYYEAIVLLNPSTVRRCQMRGWLKNLENHFENKDILVKQITALEIQMIQTKLIQFNTPHSVNNEVGFIKNFFGKCVEWKFCLESPAKDIKRVKTFPIEKKLWTEAQINFVLRESYRLIRSESWFRNVIRFLRRTCMRPEEMRKLKQGDIIFIDKEDPNFTLGYCGYIKIFSKKNANGFRLIPFDYRVRRILIVQIAKCKSSDDWLFRNCRDKQIRTESIRDNILQIEKLTGIELPNPYALRHTGATKMCLKNVNLRKVQIYLGHSNIATTLQYTLVGINDLQDCIKGV